MQTQQKLFTNRMLLTLLWPLVVEQALNVLVGMSDTVMVSQLALGNQLCIASCDLILAFIGPFLLDITQGNSEALSLCKCLSNTLAHSASANNANFHSCASC